MRSVYAWGTTPGEDTLSLPCDDVVADGQAYLRAVDVAAPPEIVFAWLGQLRVAPYSYDWIDNLGRRSPDRLDPSLGPLEVGQRAMTIFRVADVDPGRSVTLAVRSGFPFGRAAVTYAVRSTGTGSRLVAKLRWAVPRWLRWLAGAGDLVMMRKQLRTLARYAERDARGVS